MAVCGANWVEYSELKRLRATNAAMQAALKDVDALWSKDATSFAEEMNLASPVGIVWAKVRAALAKAEGK